MPLHYNTEDWCDAAYRERMSDLLVRIALGFPECPWSDEELGGPYWSFPPRFPDPQEIAPVLGGVLRRMIEVYEEGGSPAEAGFGETVIEGWFSRWGPGARGDRHVLRRFSSLTLEQAALAAETIRLVADRNTNDRESLLREVPEFWMSFPEITSAEDSATPLLSSSSR